MFPQREYGGRHSNLRSQKWRLLARQQREEGMLKEGQESGSARAWFTGVVIAILLVIGGMEVNPGPQGEQMRIDQILT
jgi:hypothetical protein